PYFTFIQISGNGRDRTAPMDIKRRYRGLALAIFSGWLALSFACNMPVGSGGVPEAPAGSLDAPGGISKEALRQTLEAQPAAAEQGTLAAPGSPFEGIRTATPAEAGRGGISLD